MTDGIYGCDTCNTTAGRAACPTHQDKAGAGVAVHWAFAHRHAWRYDGTDGPYYVYHCDEHDPPVIRRVWQTEADNR